MAIAMHDEGGNLFRLEVSGTLQKADLERCQDDLVKHILRAGPVKLLFVLEGFEGWGRGDNWNDLSFYIKHGDSIKRIAIVGDERWRSEALMFAGAELAERAGRVLPRPGRGGRARLVVGLTRRRTLPPG